MRLIVVTKGFPPTTGGIERLAGTLVKGLQQRHDIRVITFMPENDQPDSLGRPAMITTVPISPIGLVNYVRMRRALKTLIRAERPDMIVSLTWKTAIPVLSGNLVQRIPVILIAHGAELVRYKQRPWIMMLMRRIFSAAQHVIAVSHVTKEMVLEFTRVPSDRVTVVHNGIDLDPIKPVNSAAARRQLGFPDDLLLATISRLEWRKGHEVVLRLLPKLRQAVPNLRYIIVGDGSYRSKLEAIAKELGDDADYVSFTGRVSDSELPLYYSACDIFIMLNRKPLKEDDFEGFGLALAEAGAYGKPSIAGDNSGPREVIIQGETGLLVDPEDDEAVFNAIHTLCLRADLRQSMGAQAKSHIRSRHSMETMVAGTEVVLAQQLAIHSGHSIQAD